MAPIKQKQWFLVQVDADAPITVRFRVFAEDEEEAFKLVEKSPNMIQQDGRPHVDFKHMRKRRVSIKNTLTGMINWIKNF